LLLPGPYAELRLVPPPVMPTSRRFPGDDVGMGDVPERTEDGRYVIIRGRRWRATDPAIPRTPQRRFVPS